LSAGGGRGRRHPRTAEQAHSTWTMNSSERHPPQARRSAWAKADLRRARQVRSEAGDRRSAEAGRGRPGRVVHRHEQDLPDRAGRQL
jgi:hypothetical protein